MAVDPCERNAEPREKASHVCSDYDIQGVSDNRWPQPILHAEAVRVFVVLQRYV